MTGVGIAWASTLSMPYAVLAGSLPASRTGVYMGIFNFFIVLPEIVASLAFGWIMGQNSPRWVFGASVVFMASTVLLALVTERNPEKTTLEAPGAKPLEL